MPRKRTNIVIGTGHAGVEAAMEMRRAGFTGRIILLGQEAHAPYERPPLSKGLLTGDIDVGSIGLGSAASRVALGIELRLEDPVTQLAPRDRMLSTSKGLDYRYDGLLLATGARPRKLPVPVDPEIPLLSIRSLADSLLLRQHLARSRRLVIVGAGLIGLEVAASARTLGLEVSVIQAGPRVMARSVPPVISGLLQSLHADRGVAFRMNTSVEHIARTPTGALLRLSNGDDLPADLVVAAVGAEPNVELARVAGLDQRNGIVVNESCRTSASHIHAAGDAATQFHPLYGRHIRLESWRSAIAQGRPAGRGMSGCPTPQVDIPWTWSSQYDVTMQSTGLFDLEHDEIVTRNFDKEFALCFALAGGVLRGACGVSPGARIGKQIKLCEMLIGRSQAVAADDLRNPRFALSSLLDL